MKITTGDQWLDERYAKSDTWIKEGKIPASTKVIPVSESLSTLQWVLPGEQVTEILRNARVFALGDCACRTRYKRCDNPLETCFFINDVADKKIAAGEAHKIALAEAEETVKLANRHGLIHLTIYNPRQHVYAVCSCCDCCCHDMQIMKLYNRPDMVAYSDYVVHTDESLCNHCGVCVERCKFGAKELVSGKVCHDMNKCYGCGLCVTVCPEEANRLELRKQLA